MNKKIKKNFLDENKQNTKNIKKKIQSIISDMNRMSKNDPDGSYTGVADPPCENVVQDVDDL